MIVMSLCSTYDVAIIVGLLNFRTNSDQLWLMVDGFHPSFHFYWAENLTMTKIFSPNSHSFHHFDVSEIVALTILLPGAGTKGGCRLDI